MSTIKVDAFQDTSGRGYYPCRAWINFNMVTPAINGEKGVSSLLDRATGDFDISLDNAMSNANYSLAGYTNSNGTTSNFSSNQNVALGINYSSSTFGMSTTGFSFNSYVGGTGPIDAARNFAQVFGDM